MIDQIVAGIEVAMSQCDSVIGAVRGTEDTTGEAAVSNASTREGNEQATQLTTGQTDSTEEAIGQLSGALASLEHGLALAARALDSVGDAQGAAVNTTDRVKEAVRLADVVDSELDLLYNQICAVFTSDSAQTGEQVKSEVLGIRDEAETIRGRMVATEDQVDTFPTELAQLRDEANDCQAAAISAKEKINEALSILRVQIEKIRTLASRHSALSGQLDLATTDLNAAKDDLNDVPPRVADVKDKLEAYLAKVLVGG